MEQNVLTTSYSSDMDKALPLSQYPRPTLRRDSYLCLNGEWDFDISESAENIKTNKKILVPFPPESRLSGYGKEIPEGSLMHYKRTFSLPEGFLKGRVILHFGAVDTLCEVFINGRLAAKNEGGYIPFSIDITELLEEENELRVVVRDNLDKAYPYGKQTRSRGGMWYTPVSGIWQTVWLESVPASYIRSLKITPSLDSVKIEVTGGEDNKRLTLTESGEVFEFSGNEITISPKTVKHWTPETPHIYNFRIECGDDTVESYFALREIAVKEIDGIARLCLNGEPYLFNGLLDQGYFPDGLFLPATYDGYRDDILLAKSMGFNMLRKHIKVEPEIFYYLCDTLGIAVFQDMVNNSDYSFFFDTALPTIGIKSISDKHRHKNPRSRAIFEREMYKTLDHLYNFPSIVYYTVFNEGWGQFCADEMYKKAKVHDGTRIYDATSGWFTEKESDVDSRHVYFKTVKLGRRGKRPIVISEFGGYSHRVKGHLFGDKNYGYRTFNNIADFEDAFIRLYEGEIEPLVPLGVSALVYTQLSDVEDETNGIVTYDRLVVKLNSEKIRPMMERIKSKIL
ncbi:MAG: glycoside hydrolase family 2 [Clostridia bacterium]|nr:glycoside hydrolase family 2 [Clostridia bacterium]